MKKDNVTDHEEDEYYTNKEEKIFEHGYQEGLFHGLLWGALALLCVLVFILFSGQFN